MVHSWPEYCLSYLLQMDWLKDLIFPKEIKLFQVEEEEELQSFVLKDTYVLKDGRWSMTELTSPSTSRLQRGRHPPQLCTPQEHSGLTEDGRPQPPLTPASNICTSSLQLAGPAAVLSGESYESLVRDLRQEWS